MTPLFYSCLSANAAWNIVQPVVHLANATIVRKRTDGNERPIGPQPPSCLRRAGHHFSELAAWPAIVG